MSEEQKSSRRGQSSFLYGDLGYGPKEAFKRLRTNVVCSFDDDKCHVIGMTSAKANEGKTLISINLASSLAEMGKKVILLDGDAYRPSIHRKLALSSEKGLAELAKNDGSFSVAVQRYTDKNGQFSFDFVANGEVPENPSEVLNHKGVARLIAKLRESYDYVIVDMPPVGSVSDVASFARNMDGMLVVVHESHTPRPLLKECMDQLSYAKARILGFVMNGSLAGTGTGYGGGKYAYRYGYGYGYGKKSDSYYY